MKKKRIETAPARLGLQRSLASSLLAAAILAAGCAPPQPEPTSEWEVSDESNLEPIDHGPWHDILRPIWRDKRIHYAVNCAAYSCPQLIDTAFTAANTESLLEAGARAYVNSARGVDVVDDESIVLSSIYKWYPEDFGGTEESVIKHLTQYADGELAAFLEGFGGTIDYDYDWRRETCRARNARGGWRWSTTS